MKKLFVSLALVSGLASCSPKTTEEAPAAPTVDTPATATTVDTTVAPTTTATPTVTPVAAPQTK